MLNRGLVLVVSFAMASSAFAGATVELVVTDLGNTPCNGIDGCVFGEPFYHGGGDTVLVHVMVTASQDLLVRGAQIDWGGSSRELDLGRDIDTVNQPLDGVPNFWFDYSPIILAGVLAQGTYPATGIGPIGLPTTGGYIDFSNLQEANQPVAFVAATVWGFAAELPGMLALEAGVPYRLGGMTLTIPTEPGVYTLDVLNLANTDNSNFGMVLDFGFGGDGDPITKWASAAEGEGVDDVITYAYGPLTFVIPEPVTLILLGLGGLAAAARRQASPVPPTRAD